MNPPRIDTLYLIDGSSFIFRAFHALPDMTREDGVHVNAVYGFCNMLSKLLSDLKAERIAVIFDADRKTFRNDIYPEYKAHRPPPPPELIPQFPLIREATRAYGIPAIELEGYEADDLIASYAREALAKGIKVRIVGTDKDLMQLVRPGVEMFDPLKSTPIGPAEIEAKFGVPPEKIADVQALAGDSTDNIPGVPGIGVKTAAQLINEYGSLENLLARAHEIKQPKRREALEKNAELALISKRLVTLDDEVPLPLPLEQLKARKDHLPELIDFLKKQGFRSILARMDNIRKENKEKQQEKETAKDTDNEKKGSIYETELHDALKNSFSKISPEYELVQDVKSLNRWVEMAREQGYVAIDTETDSLTPSTAKLVGVSLAVAPGKACYIPVGHIDPSSAMEVEFFFEQKEAVKQLKTEELVSGLKDLLVDSSVLKIGHNLKFDLQVLKQYGLDIEPYDDTILMSYVLFAGLHGHSLDELSLKFFQHKMISFTDIAGAGKKQTSFDRLNIEKACDYAAEDADYTLRLWLLLKPMVSQRHVTRVYERIERPLVPVIAEMESTGVRIDPAVLNAQSNDLSKRLQKLEEEIYKLAGHPFNVSSPKQLGEVLFKELGLPGGTKSKTGTYSTSVDVLEPLAFSGHEIAAKVLDWRALSKLKTTYTDSLPEQIDTKTGRVHTSFSMVGAATGRLSSTDPNLQNIPIRTEEGRAIRRAFIADKGCVLLSVDYSQIELRLAAEAADVKALIQAFHEGIDIHALTASQVFDIPLNKITPELRRKAKAINFGIIYGISGFGLAKQIGCSTGEANEFIRQYLDRFYELRDWIESIKELAHKQGYVETMFGRRVHVPDIHDRSAARRNAAERQAINAPLQGTAADIMKRAMIRIPPALVAAKLKAKLLLQVHDELLFEVPEEEANETADIVKKIMQEAPLPALRLKVPLIAEAKYGKNWAEAH